MAEPGSYQAGKNFGEGLNNVYIGAPFKFVPKEGPGPGEYRSDSPLTKSRAREAIIREDIIQQKRKPEPTPDPGAYDAHLTPFGSGLKRTADMGSKY